MTLFRHLVVLSQGGGRETCSFCEVSSLTVSCVEVRRHDVSTSNWATSTTCLALQFLKIQKTLRVTFQAKPFLDVHLFEDSTIVEEVRKKTEKSRFIWVQLTMKA